MRPTHGLSMVLMIPLIIIAAVVPTAIEAQAVVATPSSSGSTTTSSSSAAASTSASIDSTADGTCSYNGSVSEYLTCQKSKVSTTALVCGGIGVTLSVLLIVFGGIFLCQRNRRRGMPAPTDLSAYAEEEDVDEDEKLPMTEDRAKKDMSGYKRGVRRAGMGDKAGMVESGTDEEMGTPPPPFRAVAPMDTEGGGNGKFRPAPPSLAIGERQGSGNLQANSIPRSQAQAQAQARYHAQVQAQTRNLAARAPNNQPLNPAVEKDLPPQPIVPTINPLDVEIQARQSASPHVDSTPPNTVADTPTEPSAIVDSPSPATQPRTLYPSNPDTVPTQAPRSRPPTGNRPPTAMRQSSYNKRQSMASVQFAPPVLPPPNAAPPLPDPSTRPMLNERDTFGSPPSRVAPLNIRKSSAPTINSGIPSYYEPGPRPGGGRRPSATDFYDAKTGQPTARPASKAVGSDVRPGMRPGMIMRGATEGRGMPGTEAAIAQGRRPSAPGGLGGERRPLGGRKGSEDRGGMI